MTKKEPSFGSGSKQTFELFTRKSTELNLGLKELRIEQHEFMNCSKSDVVTEVTASSLRLELHHACLLRHISPHSLICNLYLVAQYTLIWTIN